MAPHGRCFFSSRRKTRLVGGGKRRKPAAVINRALDHVPIAAAEGSGQRLSLLKNVFGVGIGLQMIAAEFMGGPYIADVCDRGE
jgi:hypothetical protein